MRYFGLRMPLIFFFHAMITWALVGMIWHVQRVQYPRFFQVGEDAFGRYHMDHCFRISFMVVPLILLEVATAGWLIWAGQRGTLFLSSLVLIALAWICTFALQVPLHNRLTEGGKSDEMITRLISTNWLRTVAWTMRGVMVGWMCFGGVG
ncbi:hypothetical protein EI77_02837 [Prosthecobacter fusiformis]|uniref:DUF1772 domain-containing protein n=2 Tax=Prosthecobacter fusiformis TaxID=48464 RepID=A0A4R7S089_9BACT|nr:hypothetical protein EI77_02837 [Prosthecobacter fusiformis]